MAAVFAPEKVYECASSDAFNCLPKSQFAAAMRTGLTDANRLQGVLHQLGEVRVLTSFQLKAGLHDSAHGEGTVGPATVLRKTIV